jgi:hypothetical protein
MVTEIILKEKSIYGNTLVYPDCVASVLFSRLIGKKTFNGTDIYNIEQLGYKVIIKKL